MLERSKLFKKMGTNLGIQNQKRSHRGYVARRYMKKVDSFEMAEFEKKMVKFDLRQIPVKVGGEIVAYL